LERRRKEKKLLLFLPIDHCSVSSWSETVIEQPVCSDRTAARKQSF
jgi:hypothetical protein